MDDKALILIVDDTPKNLQLLGSILSKANYEVAVATSGPQALNFLTKRQPNLILLDIMMPEMDGFEVAQNITKNPATKDIPFMFVSAMSDTDSKVKGFEYGAKDYITKPFQVAEILARVKTHLQLKKALDTVNEYNTKLEDMLESRTKELIKSERNSAFSLLSQGIVHNLKNPLTIIYGGSQILEFSKPDMSAESLSDPVKKYIELAAKTANKVNTSVNRMLDMINSLMAKSRTDKSDALEDFDLNELLTNELEFLTADLHFKNKVEKEINVHEGTLIINAIPGEISQILQNLIRNALDAMHKQEAQSLAFSTGKEKNHIWLSIKDNGPGIPEDLQQKIFDPFFTTKPKATEKKTKEPTGTGLGLHMCAQMVESYKGYIKLNSKVGEGSEFKLFFPAVTKKTLINS